MITKVRRTTARAMTIKRPAAIPLTKVGFDKAKVDYDLLQTKREEVLIRLQAAREMGDLSENGAYTAAKFELGSIDREIRRLGYLIKYGVVTSSTSGNTIGFGNEVTLEKNGKQMSFVLVSGYESNPSERKLSEQSPFGKAVIGHKVGETIVVVAPAGEISWKIVKVS
ncbi:MAG: GreA/GreB family elongation factor [bacterium]